MPCSAEHCRPPLGQVLQFERISSSVSGQTLPVRANKEESFAPDGIHPIQAGLKRKIVRLKFFCPTELLSVLCMLSAARASLKNTLPPKFNRSGNFTSQSGRPHYGRNGSDRCLHHVRKEFAELRKQSGGMLRHSFEVLSTPAPKSKTTFYFRFQSGSMVQKRVY